MIGVPRGRYLGKRLGDLTKSDAEHFIPALPAAAGSTAGICSSIRAITHSPLLVPRSNLTSIRHKACDL